MINWFGPRSWDAPICHDAPRCEIPVGVPCTRCTRPLTEDDCGVTMPGFEGPAAFHAACNLKMVLPHTLWPRAGLIPDETDGLVDGVFRCTSCGMTFSRATGWALDLSLLERRLK